MDTSRTNLLTAFADTLRQGGSRVAVVDAVGAAQRREVTYRQLLALVGGVQAALAARGVSPGDRVAVMLPNGLEFVVCYLASLYSGFAIVPINPAVPAPLLDHMLTVAKPSLLVHRAAVLSRSDVAIPQMNIDLAATGDADPALLGTPDALHTINFTSGTTGLPKGLAHRSGGMVGNVQAFNRLVGFDEVTCMLHVMPMYYMAGYLNTVLSPLAAGGRVVLLPPLDAQSVLRFWPTAMAENVNTAWLSPTMAHMVTRLARSEDTLAWIRRAMRFVLVGTAALPMTIRDAFEAKFGVPALESYGMSELLLVSAQTLDRPASENSCGRMLPGIEIAARVGKEGEAASLSIRTPYTFAGYLDPATGEVQLKESEWLETGDVGRVENDTLFITGRTKDIVIRGGFNVSPRAIEDALLQCEDIEDAVVFGIPDPVLGEQVVVCLKLSVRAANECVALAREKCAQVLAPESIPGRFEVPPFWPTTPTGKVRKAELRDWILTDGLRKVS